MRDPIAEFERIRDFYLTYLDTAFRIADPYVQQERRRLLELYDPPTLCTEPLIEPIPRYETAGLRIDDLAGKSGDNWLPGFPGRERELFVRLSLAGLLPCEQRGDAHSVGRGAFELYRHQLEMLQRGVSVGHPGIVTSGTGSGKTEAFLLPILASIVKEACGWPASEHLDPAPRWWRSKSNGRYSVDDFAQLVADGPERVFVDRRWGESVGRPKAVRALLLYPMNALVEDQLVRLRRALDSDQSQRVLDCYLGGNRIFFGRYTSATPVTGYLKHPRRPGRYRKKSARGLTELFRRIVAAEATWQAAMQESVRREEEDLPYNFQRIGGSELFSRWDMHASPPDILITNTSMLSALLTREVDGPIWSKTREWLHSESDSYFYLVMDELHLQRGTAGTEVAFLLRTLIHRLGLHLPEHRHKLRILASSASFPMKGEEREASLRYLWEMFGPSGFGESRARPELWSDSVVTGREVHRTPGTNTPLDATSIVEAVAGLEDSNSAGAFMPPSDNRSAWWHLARLVGVDPEGRTDGELVRGIIRAVADLVSEACREGNSGVRATPASKATNRLFGTDERGPEALRAVLRLRSITTSLGSWFPEEGTANRAIDASSLRIHLFFRAVEGLFAAPRALSAGMDEPARKQALFSNLSVEPGQRFSETEEGQRVRFLELLYCECCGELYLGGMKGSSQQDSVEFLPSDPDPDRLPEHPKPQLFEQLTADDFALYWPTTRANWPWGGKEPMEEHAQGRWRRAELDPATGRAHYVSPGAEWSGSTVPGFLYDTSNWRTQRMRRCDPGSAVPYQCPFCGESYVYRRTRTSPIRNFRVGFAKTTQLLASELVARLRAHAATPEAIKIVSFADSRQDAANAALDLEKRHHEDIRREYLVSALQSADRARADPVELDRQLKELEKVIATAVDRGDFSRVPDLSSELRALQRKRADAPEKSIALTDLVDVAGGAMIGRRVKPVTAALLEAGVHPIDPAGIDPISVGDGDFNFSWQQLFRRTSVGWKWADHPALREALKEAHALVKKELRRLATETIFHRSYFSLEESGLGYGCVASNGRDQGEIRTYNALMRLLGDKWRYRPRREEWSDPPRVWIRGVDATKDVQDFAKAIWGSNWSEALDEAFAYLRQQGHKGCILGAEYLRIMPVSSSDPFWRCATCGRVHLHTGAGICTRCLESLPSAPSGQVRSLRDANYLARRVEDPSRTYRLRAEELTAMTSNPGARLRRFNAGFWSTIRTTFSRAARTCPSTKRLTVLPAS